MSRRDQVAAGLAGVRQRIATACVDAGRAPDDVTLVVVTKYFPASDVRLLVEHGVTDVGENRHQEAEAKWHECSDLAPGLRWHFVGALQSNKAAAVATYADVVHSVDRGKLVGRLDAGASARPHPIDVLLQVSLDPPERSDRAGADPADLAELGARVADARHLRLRGLMAVAPLGEDPAAAFARLSEVRREFLHDHPSADWLSAGMSGDLEAAIKAGATHVRIGTSVLGSRPSVQ